MRQCQTQGNTNNKTFIDNKI